MLQRLYRDDEYIPQIIVYQPTKAMLGIVLEIRRLKPSRNASISDFSSVPIRIS